MINEAEVDTDAVSVGTLVHVKDQKSGESRKFRIVGSAEADPAAQKLSNESPIGRALLGHKRLDTTAHYTRVATDLISKVVSPLDQLAKKGKKDEPPK